MRVINKLSPALMELNNQLEELELNKQNDPMPIYLPNALKEGHSLL